MTSVVGVVDRFDIVGTRVSSQIERAQIYLSSLLNAANQRISILHDNAILFFEELNIQERLSASWDLIVEKGEEFTHLFRNMGVHVYLSPHITNIKAFFRNEVSQQAIYFGCAGLVTGGMIGLCIGYTVKQSSLSSLYFASPGNGAPTLMKAILCYNSRRGTEGISLSTVAVPRHIGSNQVLVQVKAMGLDNIDVRLASGYGHLLRRRLGFQSILEPFVLGRECSGIVLEVGSEVTSYTINDKVWICLPLWAPVGVMSEYAVVSQNCIGLKPRNISFEGAATLPYAALIVWREIIPKSNLGAHTSKNKRILVHLGPTSKNDGVGLLATQVLKSWGARVTISTLETEIVDEDNDEGNSTSVAQMTFLHTLKSLGAESHIILPNDADLLPDLAQRIFDVVINTDSSAVTPLLENFAKDPRDAVIETFPSNLTQRYTWSVFHLFESTVNFFFKQKEEEESIRSILDECRRLVESGFVVPVVSRSFLTSQYDQAFRHVANTSNPALAHVGKSVLVFKILPSSPPD